MIPYTNNNTLHRRTKINHSGTVEEQKENITRLKAKIDRQKDKNAQMAGEVKMLRKRELEIVKRWDFDDIDLVTDRL